MTKYKILTDRFSNTRNVQIARQMVGDISKKISIFRHIINLPKFRLNQLRRINKNSLYIYIYYIYMKSNSILFTYIIPMLSSSFQHLLHCSVNDLAEDKLKVFGSSFDWNNKAIINRLFSLFQGSLPQQQGRPQASAPVGRVELQRSPISLRVKIKVLPYLLKSQLAASMFPQSLQVRGSIPLLCIN